MNQKSNQISVRKNEHIELCLTDEVSFVNKTTGFENYDFIHEAATEIELDKINFDTKLLGKKVSFPFLISCMTGGTSEAEKINSRLAVSANELNIPIGVGSQRQSLEGGEFDNSYLTIRKNAPSVPVISNIGAAQLVKTKSNKPFKKIIDQVEGDALVIHLNPLQELIQFEGEPNFKGLLKRLEGLIKELKTPVFVKEVGSGISITTARRLLEIGVQGIDVAGAGGTSWAGVEALRQKSNITKEFWDWGIPTSYCIKEIKKLKKKYNFVLIGSGGINSSFEMAKAFALGADITASARIVLQTLNQTNEQGVINLINSWFDDLRKILFLTGSKNISALQKNKLVRKENYF